MPDDPSDEDVAPTPSLTEFSASKRGSRKSAHRGILPIGFVLNGIYEVKRFIARGGMGEVYEGVNVNAEERVAIKVILPHLAADPKVQALFRKEAKTLTSLAHPALVQYRVLAREPRKDLLYIVTDFIDGEALTHLIGRNPPTAAELIMLTRRLAEGLHAAHSHGAIHRDISPENILLPDGVLSRAKIIDFGIAKSMEIGAHTVVGDGFAGKLGYVAPEQFGDFDRRIGPWTDVYSLGLVVLALAGGKAPDMGTTLVEAIDRRRAGADLGAVPPLLQPLFSRMLSPDPRGRPQTMADVISALDALDVPFEPPSVRTWGAPPVDAPSLGEPADLERTVIHFGSEPPSWQSAEPRGQGSLPPSLDAVESDAVEPDAFEEIAPEARTIFAPSITQPPATLPPSASATTRDEVTAPTPVGPPIEPEPVIEPPLPPITDISVVESPSPTPPPSEDEEDEEDEEIGSPLASVFTPSPEGKPPTDVEPDPTPIANEAEDVAPRPVFAAATTRPGSQTTSAIPPAMDVAYNTANEESGDGEPVVRRRLDVKLAVGGVVAAVVVVGVGFAVLSAQKKAGLPALPPAASAPAPPNVVRAEQAITAALPNVPCAWLTVSRGQSADGSTNIKVSGTAGDLVAANRAVAGAAQSAGAAGLQVDTTEILQADQASCPLLDTVGKFAGPRDVAPSLLVQQARFEIDRGIQGCPTGLWAQSMIHVAADPNRDFSLIAIQPNGRLQQFAGSRAQFTALAARNPNLYQHLGGGRYRVSMCQNTSGLAGVLMIEGAAPFDIGLRAGALERPRQDFPARLRQAAQQKGWTMQMAWFQVVNDQPDLPEQASTDEAARHKRDMLAAEKAAAAQAAAAAAPVVVEVPPVEPQKLPADHVACRRFVGGAWEELGYATRASCTEQVFAGRCDVLSGQSGDIALRRYGNRLQAKTGRGLNKWANVGKSDCAK